jgi:hypothetical protein
VTAPVRTLTAAVAEYRAAIAAEAAADDVEVYSLRTEGRMSARRRRVDIEAELTTRDHAALARLLRMERVAVRAVSDAALDAEKEPVRRLLDLDIAAHAIQDVQRYLAEADADGRNILG